MKSRQFNLQKYIDKLKVAKAPAYVIGKEKAMGLRTVQHPSININEPIPKDLQISEFYGLMKEDHNYLSDNYKHHLLTLKQIDSDYINNKTIEQRVLMSRNAIEQWKGFIENSSKNLPEEEFKVREDILIKLEDIWMRFKKRNKQTVTAEEVLPFHYEFTKHYDFDIPLHPKNLAMILHPHWGFFCKFTKHEFSFKNIVDFYYDEFVSSHYRNIGRDILANRISAYNYWKIVDHNLKGFLPLQEFLYLLESVAFNVDNLDSKSIQNEFHTAIATLKNEFSEQEKTNIFRFRLFEFIFMERCAIY